jgi:hypothetical protein
VHILAQAARRRVRADRSTSSSSRVIASQDWVCRSLRMRRALNHRRHRTMPHFFWNQARSSAVFAPASFEISHRRGFSNALLAKWFLGAPPSIWGYDVSTAHKRKQMLFPVLDFTQTHRIEKRRSLIRPGHRTLLCRVDSRKK